MNRWLLPAAERDRRAAEDRLRVHAWSRGALAAIARLRGAGARAWLVGGSVRDAVRGSSTARPLDLATDAAPERLRELFPGAGEGRAPRGTIPARCDGTLLACECIAPGGGLEALVEDLERRELTIGALAFAPGEALVDPTEGAHDLARRLLRAPGEPERRLGEDPLRALRVARFAAALEFRIDGALEAALGGVRDRLAALPAARVRDELSALLRAARPSTGFELLRRARLLAAWLPELEACRGVPQNRHHAFDVWFHALHSCDAADPARPVLRWAALLHDIGKPGTRAERGGEGTFYGHERLGAALAGTLLWRLEFPAAFRERVVLLVREHMFHFGGDASDAAVRRWLERVGEDAVAELFDLRLADAQGNGLRSGNPAALDALAARIQRLLAADARPAEPAPALDGDDVMRALGLPPGPAVGRALAALRAAVRESPACNTRAALLSRLRRSGTEA